MKRVLAAAIICLIVVLVVVTSIHHGTKSFGKYGNTRLPKVTQDTDNGFTPGLPDLEEVLAKDHTWIATLSGEHIRTILVTGDIIPARSVNVGVLKRNNPLWPYEKVIDPIKNLHADIIFADLETPLIHDCDPTIEGMIFCGNERNVEGLKAIGVTVASLANNHAGNYDVAGVVETARHLQENGIAVTGVKGAYIKDLRGIKFAFLGYNDISTPQPGIANADETLIAREIAEAKKQADVVVVMYHWGIEYRAQPDDRQKYLAHYTIDNGADIVVSNHPHWIQPVEIYKNKYIMYAHGNFIFDQMWSEETKKGVLGLYTFYDKQLIDARYIPIHIEQYGQAKIAGEKEKNDILDNLRNQSLVLQQAH